MFDLFRSQRQTVKILLSVILGLVALSMVITLIPGSFSSQTDFNDPVLVEVGDSAVTIRDVQMQLRDYVRSGQVPADSLAFMANQVIENKITEKVMIEEARALGLEPDEKDLAKWIRDQLPFLFPNGVYVGTPQYASFVQQRFQQSVPEFEANIHTSLTIDTFLKRFVTDSVTLTDDELRDVYRREKEKVKIEFVSVSSSSFRSKVDVGEEALNNYFETNKFRYRVQESRSIKLMTIGPDATLERREYSNEEVERYYLQNRYRFEEPAQVQASHILFSTQDKSDEEKKTIRVKADEILQQVKDGADFAAMAKEHSEDPGSGANGGSLGWVAPGAMVPEFEQATFGLKAGEISGIVETEFGYHIIKAFARRDAELKPLDQVRGEIKLDLAAEQAGIDRLQLIDRAMGLVRENGKNVEIAAQQLGLPVEHLEDFTMTSAPQQLAVAPAIMSSVFGGADGAVVTAETQAGQTLIAVITSIKPARDPEISEVAGQVREDYVTQQTQELAKARADEIAAQAKAAGEGGLQQVARQSGLTVKTSDFVDRAGSIDGLGAAQILGDPAFRADVGTVFGPVRAGDDVAIYRVVAHQEPDMSGFDVAKQALKETELGSRQTEAFEIFKSVTRKRYEEQGRIKRFDARIDEFLRALARSI